MIKTADGIHEYSNGYNTYYFINQFYYGLRLGLRLNDLSVIAKTACLIIDEDGLKNKTMWPQVTSRLRLVGKFKELKRQVKDIKGDI